MNWQIWATAATLYALFHAWYVGVGRRLSTQEIERLMTLLDSHGAEPAQREGLRSFLQQDTGRSFVMVNLLQLAEPKAKAREAMALYQKRFLGRLLRHAGHPLFLGRAASARNIEQWGIEADGWDVVGLIRYRSRRDLARMVEFSFREDAVRAAKHQALQKTFAVPVDPWMVTGGVCVVVALTLALLASIAQWVVG
jgi:hypothetical protein